MGVFQQLASVELVEPRLVSDLGRIHGRCRWIFPLKERMIKRDMLLKPSLNMEFPGFGAGVACGTSRSSCLRDTDLIWTGASWGTDTSKSPLWVVSRYSPPSPGLPS